MSRIPPNVYQMCVRLPLDLKEAIDRAADEDRRTLADVVRLALADRFLPREALKTEGEQP